MGYTLGMEPIPETSEAVEEFGPFTDPDLLHELRERSDRVTALVPDCVGLSLASAQHGVTFTLVATSLQPALLDGVQYLSGGPCVDAVRADRVVQYHHGDVLDEDLWQDFARATAAGSVASTLTLPVLVDGVVGGSVNLYASSTDAFAGRHEEIARIFDAWAPGAVTNADLSFSTRQVAEQAPRRLRADVDIQVAVGILSASRGLGAGEARDQLTGAARRAGVSEADLAAVVIEIARDQDGDPHRDPDGG